MLKCLCNKSVDVAEHDIMKYNEREISMNTSTDTKTHVSHCFLSVLVSEFLSELLPKCTCYKVSIRPSRDCKQYNNGRSYYRLLLQWEFRENFPDLPFLNILISNANETSRNNERRSSIELSAVAYVNVCVYMCVCAWQRYYTNFIRLSTANGICVCFT